MANLLTQSLLLSAMKFAEQDVVNLTGIIAEAQAAFRTSEDTFCGALDFKVVDEE